MSRCPSAGELEALLEEQLPDAQRRTVSNHVGGCAACQATLERLTADTVVLAGPRALPPARADGGGAGTEALSPFLARLKETSVQAVLGGLRDGRPAGPVPPRDAAAAPPAAGFPTVPGYEILGELGRGGMGVVYQARHLGLNRLVALKMILAGPHAGPKDLARFRHEAEAVARVHHPNIVQIYDVGEADGLPYIALEFVPEGSLARRLHGDPQPVEAAVRLIETLAGA